MQGILNREVLRTPLDRGDGSLGARKLAILVVAVIAVGATIIFFGQRFVAAEDTWTATVTGVATKGRVVNFTFEEDSDDSDVASYPAGMAIQEGDKVLIRIDETKGNSVVKILDH